MDLSRLTAIEKRLVEWRRTLQNGPLAQPEASEITELTERLHALLYKAWDDGAMNAEDSYQVSNLERRLEALFERSHYAPSDIPRGTNQ